LFIGLVGCEPDQGRLTIAPQENILPHTYKNGKIIGGLGVSCDTSCTDHEIAKRVRNAANLNPPGGATADDISYSSKDGASAFTHALCPNTFRNGVFIGNEAAAVGY
jgi:hypothetical protein